MAIYESEHTKFMREWMKQHPEEIEECKEGRALWWDKGTRDLDTQRREQRAAVAQKAYYYDIN
jgi:hypothetical protein